MAGLAGTAACGIGRTFKAGVEETDDEFLDSASGIHG
jgi:hypothetical protein